MMRSWGNVCLARSELEVALSTPLSRELKMDARALNKMPFAVVPWCPGMLYVAHIANNVTKKEHFHKVVAQVL